jgi:triacylglycerol esterase/lipase EstA (alpha/beta hydrolase family)
MFANVVRAALLMELAAWTTLGLWLAGRNAWGAGAVAATVIAGMAGLRLAIVGKSHVLSWFGRSPRKPEERLGAGGTLVLVLREWLAMLANNFAWLPFEHRVLRADPPLAPDARIPVIVVHGYLSNRGTMSALVHALDDSGVGPVFVPSLPLIFAPIEEFAAHLDCVLDEVNAATRQPRAILVCHSMGGLIARELLAAHGTGRLQAVITLGSPHHGTALAPLGTGANARQMRRGSEFLRGLELREGESGPGCPFTSLYTVHDNLVAPQDSSCLPWARNVAFHGVGHLAMLQDARVHRAVLDALAAAGARVPGR